MWRFWFLGGIIALAATIMTVQKINHSINYTPAMASITSVDSDQCYLQSVSHGLMTRTTRTTEKMPCAEAESLRLTHPAYRGMDAMGLLRVHFTYVSPVDQQSHEGVMSYAHEDYSGLASASPGSELPILVHKSDPTATAHDYSRMENYASPPAPEAVDTQS